MKSSLSTTEVWKDIVGYPSYQVSNMGKVKSLKCGRNKYLKDATTIKGYKVVCLSSHGKHMTLNVHKIVAMAFLGEKPSHLIIDHVDGNRANNRIDNLQYITYRANNIKGNLSLLKNNKSSKYVGVSRKKGRSRWRAAIGINGSSFHIGTFDTELQAAKAYDRMWIKCG